MVDFVLRRLIIPIVLTLVYVFFVGLSSVVSRIFRIKIVKGLSHKDSTFWIKSRDSIPDKFKMLKQS